MVVGDDQFKPEVAKQLFERYVKRDKVDFMTGVVFSNIMLAALADAGTDRVGFQGPNAAPSSIAGKDCNPRFFAVSWPNDAYHEAAGSAAFACLMASIVCGMMPSSAATTRITMSVTWAPRARMAVKASWPGVSKKVTNPLSVFT